MAKQGNIQALSQVFRILGDPTRLSVLVALQAGEMNVSDLCKKLRVPQPTVSHHLGILRMAGLVLNQRRGKEIHYSVLTPPGSKGARAIRLILKDASLR